jgi:hypothetical protein
MENNKEMGWEKEFDKKFPACECGDPRCYANEDIDRNYLIKFIHSLLSQQRQEIVEKIKSKTFDWNDYPNF